jgi:hypothetical protein
MSLLVAAAPATAATSYDRNHAADLAARALEGNVPAADCWGFIDGFEVPPIPRPPVVLTTDGGYRITIDRHTITIRDPIDRNRIEHWGDPHENLNGKHIKDWGGAAGWDGTRRTVELGDGSKLTLVAAGAQGVVVSTSLYDGDSNVLVNNCRNSIAHFSRDALDTAEREQTQYDGEISSFTTDNATGIATYETLGNENPAFEYIATPQLLGTSGGFANPNNVRDFFDDPRLGHT